MAADFDAVWARIVACAGQEFRTVTGRTFVYRIVSKGRAINVEHIRQKVYRTNFERVAPLIDRIDGPGSINTITRGAAYIFAILRDSRVARVNGD
jgi:hypothetical protein